MAAYKRVLLKLSGEALMAGRSHGIDPRRLNDYVDEIIEVSELGVQIGIVIGGGNIFRGLSGVEAGYDRVKGDYMGMLATIINGLALHSAFESKQAGVRLFTSIRMEPVAEYYMKSRAMEALEKGQIVIFSGGTGNPFFTTDTASSLRAVEIEADVMLKGTRVEGVFNHDPETDPEAEKFDEITFDEALDRELKILDRTAFTMCKENELPIIVFNMNVRGNLKKVILGEKIGTLVKI
ncbi:MAG: UMP kinase [Bacteroidales bacterium]|nr:UMP kinase [Bacteroidales bacterium]MBN2698677.1 UMP kinase [Bacteroidales bacterium]